MSGGWSPVLHLFAQSGGKAHWHDEKACFVPGKAMQAETQRRRMRGRLHAGVRASASPSMQASKLHARRATSSRGRIRCRWPRSSEATDAAAVAGRWTRTGHARAEAIRRFPERCVGGGYFPCGARRFRIRRACEALHGDGLRHRPGQARQHQRHGDSRAGARQDDSRDRHDDFPAELHAGNLRHFRGP